MAKKQTWTDAALVITFRGQDVVQARVAAAYAKVWMQDGDGLAGMIEGLEEAYGLVATPEVAGRGELLFSLAGPRTGFAMDATNEPVIAPIVPEGGP